jgi:hypothetical protein
VKGVQDALGRLSGVLRVTVKLQEGRIIAQTRAGEPVLPAALWKEVARVGFKPAAMDLLANGRFEGSDFLIDGNRWRVRGPLPEGKGSRAARVKVVRGEEDPPEIEALD